MMFLFIRLGGRNVPKKIAGCITVVLSLTLFTVLVSCATDKASLQNEYSMPQSEIAYFNDSFDNMREDLWDRAGYLYRKQQMQNFKPALMHFKDGKLTIETRTGGFSKGGFGSRFAFRGDFDFQLDCRMNFIKGVYGMDQVFALGVVDPGLKTGKSSFMSIGLSMKGGMNQAFLFSNYSVDLRRKKGYSKQIKYFNGSFRILRVGKKISTLYKKKGSIEWIKMDTFSATADDMLVGFQIRNFFANRTSIRANYSVTAVIDKFQINSAQQIIEDEI